jgi:hypothetical protein
MTDDLKNILLVVFLVGIVLFFISIYIIRAIFNIPSIIKLHKAQVRLLEEMAKTQGVDSQKVQTIMSETSWETLGS